MSRIRNGCTLRVSSSAAAPQYATGRALLIASFSVLLLLAAIFSVQARAASTGSEKFIPTFLVYSGGPALVAADAPRLAKFDLIDIDRFRYAEIGSNTWAAIKSLNPAVQIYLYEMGPEAPSHLDNTAQLNLNGLGRYNVSRGHFMGSLNGNRPDLFLLNSTGNRVYNLGSSNPGVSQYWYLMDFGATAYQSYWVAAVKADIIDQPWVADGVFANGCLTRASDGGYSAVPSLYPTSAAWSDAMNDFASSITAGLFGYGQKLWCNRGGSRSVEGAAAWLALDQSASPPDVVMEEGAFAVSWGAGAVQYFPESEWKRQVDTVRAISNSKVAVVSHTKLLEGQTGTDNYGRSVTYWQALWYSLGSFLLAKNDVLGNAYFMFRGGSGYNKIWWHDEYDNIDLGKAVGPYAVRRIGSVNIYWREFERGYVYVNPTATAVGTLTLPQAGRLLTHANMTSAPDSIPSVNKISLNSRRAAILLKVASAPAPDTTAPTAPAGLTGSAISPSEVNLSWGPSTDNVGVTGYMVYLNDMALASTATTSFSHTGLTPGTAYNYRVSAFDAVPNYSARTAAVAVTTPPPPPDTTAPTTPTGLTASAITPTALTLSWAAATDSIGVTGYRVYRDGALAASPTGTSASISGLSASTPYVFTVAAMDAAGNASPQSAPLSVTTLAAPDTTAPSPPTGLSASALASSSFTLSWNAATDNVGVTGYRVYNGTLVASPAGTSVPLTGLSASTTYSFTVAAVDAAGNVSPQSAPLSVTTLALLDTTPPSTPTGLTASAITSTSLTLSWDAATDNVGVVSSRVYRNGTLIIPAATSRNIPITGLSPNTQYAFTVAAVDAAGNASPQSAPLSLTTPAAPAGTACANPAGGYGGFGGNTTGGVGQAVYRVTNLNDSGAGSLRDAVSAGNRCVVFDVGGTISLTSALLVRGANITIDGFTAPSPGVSLTGWGFDWHGPNRGVANIIARGIRIRGTAYPESLGADGFQIVGVNNFVIDQVSVDQWGDGSADIADGSSNGTVQWSIFGRGKGTEPKSLLVKYGARRISLHHNLFTNTHDRSPFIAWSDNAVETPTEVVADVRNNLVWNYGWTGSSVRQRGWANVVNNYYFSAGAPTADAALYIDEGGVAYASGNYSPNGININARGNRATPFPAIAPATTDAITAAHQVVNQAGARGPNFGLDAADLNYIGEISLTPLP